MLRCLGVFFFASIFHLFVLASEDSVPSINREIYYQEIAQQYSKWLSESGMSTPANGWRLNVEGVGEELLCPRVPVEAEGIYGKSFLIKKDCSKISQKKHILRLSINDDDYRAGGWYRLNYDFRDLHGITIDERLLLKFSHMLSVPVDDVMVSMETRCLFWKFQFIENKIVNTESHICAMTTASEKISKNEISPFLKNAVVPISKDHFVGVFGLNGSAVINFLKSEFNNEGVNVKIIKYSEYYVEVIIEGLRGKIIDQQNNWERLEVMFIISPYAEGSEVRLVLDGRYAAGINRPSISSYSDMELIHSKELQLYASSLLTKLKIYFTSGDIK